MQIDQLDQRLLFSQPGERLGLVDIALVLRLWQRPRDLDGVSAGSLICSINRKNVSARCRFPFLLIISGSFCHFQVFLSFHAAPALWIGKSHRAAKITTMAMRRS
jgi:hypothetical protein